MTHTTKKGQAGGIARAACMTPEQRHEQASKAANVRWRNKGGAANKPLYVGGEYLIEASAVALVALIDDKWAVVQVDDNKPFVCDVKFLKARGL